MLLLKSEARWYNGKTLEKCRQRRIGVERFENVYGFEITK